MSELTLHERLREAAISHGHALYKIDGGERRHIYYGIKDDALAAIQKQVEDAATAPLRDEVNRLRRENEELNDLIVTPSLKRILVADEKELRRLEGACLDRNKAIEQMVEEKTGLQAKYDALKARADALVVAGIKLTKTGMPYLGAVEGFREAKAVYDAADRAGETSVKMKPSDMPSWVRSIRVELLGERTTDGFFISQDTLVGEGRTVVEAVRDALYGPKEKPEPDPPRKVESAPSPTDAAAEQEPMVGLAWVKSWIGDFGDGLRAHEARLDDLVDRADAATSRLDMHMQRMDELEGWRADVTKYHMRLNGRIAALEAARTPVPVVADEMREAFERERNLGHDIRTSLRAALAAGGAK